MIKLKFVYLSIIKKIKIMELNKQIRDIREYFDANYSYVNIGGISDEVILEFMSRGYLELFSFSGKMDLLYDYILSQGLTEIEE